MSNWTENYAASEYPITFGILAITFGAFLGGWAGSLNWSEMFGLKYVYFCLFLATLAFFLLNISHSRVYFSGSKTFLRGLPLLSVNTVLLIWMSSLISPYWHVLGAIVVIWVASAYGMRFVLGRP